MSARASAPARHALPQEPSAPLDSLGFPIRLPTPVARAALTAYAGALLGLTLWPRLAVEAGPVRVDLLIHLVAFGGLTLLTPPAELFGTPRYARGPLLRSGAAALGFALLDEAAQAIPAIGRTASWEDAAANTLAVVTATAAVWLAARGRRLLAAAVLLAALSAAAVMSVVLNGSLAEAQALALGDGAAVAAGAR